MDYIEVVTWDQYQQASMRTCMDSCKVPEYVKYGIISELGEVADLLKKEIRQPGEAGPMQYGKELGDVCWYAQAVASVHDLSLSECVKANKFEATTLYNFATEAVAKKNDLHKACGFIQYPDNFAFHLGDFMDMLIFTCSMIHGHTTALRILMAHRDSYLYTLKGRIGLALALVAVIAHEMGLNILDILRMNQQKLVGRYNQNKIAGSGGDR